MSPPRCRSGQAKPAPPLSLSHPRSLSCRRRLAVIVPASLTPLSPPHRGQRQAKPAPPPSLSPPPCPLPPFRRRHSSLSAAIVAIVLLLPLSKARAAIVSVTAILPVVAVSLLPFHLYCAAVAAKLICRCRLIRRCRSAVAIPDLLPLLSTPRCRRCQASPHCRRRCRCGFNRLPLFAVTVSASLPPLLPPHHRHHQAKPVPSPPPLLLLLSFLSSSYRRQCSTLIALPPLLPSKARAAGAAVAVAAALPVATVSLSPF